MGINVEFNPDLCLRHCKRASGRHHDECIPSPLEEGRVYSFLKHGQRNYWFDGEIPLYETEGNGPVGAPVASIQIIEATHFADSGGKMFTRGRYRVIEVFDPKDDEVKFNGLQRIKSSSKKH